MFKHGMKNTKIYNIFRNMKNRCYCITNKRYKSYGGRGIGFCEEWMQENGFISFYKWSINNGYVEGLSIDRIDNNLGYSPENCRWTTSKIQSRNMRSNRILTLNGEQHCTIEWSEILHIPVSTLRNRLFLGWSEEKTLTTKKGKYND